MGLKDGKLDNVLRLFYEYPSREFTVREVARESGMPKSTAQIYLGELRKRGMISAHNLVIVSPLFKMRKMHYFAERLFETGLVSYLQEKLAPSCIILFGSVAKGESVKESDIDIFVETTKSHRRTHQWDSGVLKNRQEVTNIMPVLDTTKKTEADLGVFEKKLGHTIQLFFEDDIHKLPTHLFNNIINGVKLYGFVKIR